MPRFVGSLFVGLTLVALLGVARHALSQPPARPAAVENDEALNTPQGRERWMQSKLSSSQRILGALTRGDLKGIEDDSRRMLMINVLQKWSAENKVEKQSDYDGQLNAFEFATKELIRHAKNDDTEGALEAYVLLTRTCVKCHQLIRDVPELK